MSIAQLIFDKVKTLPQAQAQEVLDFANFISEKYQNNPVNEQQGLIDLLLSMPQVEDKNIFDRIQNGTVHDVFD
ncbi:DUF2281 domain-containing protein [Acinetobacter puyangensis]|uniref:DUF2281 domain-containing protein n=1 Tax=Acinetobacter puyangensis TaxID=1096779 RepID=UPI003A4D8A60